MAQKESYKSPLRARLMSFKRYLENYRHHIFFLIVYYGITIGVFCERFWHYLAEEETKGVRRLVTATLPLSRGAAGAMSFSFSVLLLTMCRNIITLLRHTFLNQHVPFDSNVAFHKIIAWTALFFTGLHVLGYAFNVYQLGTQSVNALCALETFHFRHDSPPKLDFIFFRNLAGFTGILLCLVICVMYVFASNISRRHIFDAFWKTHLLYAVLYVLIIMHGFNRVVQNPWFIYYFAAPGFLFVIDKLISLSRKRVELRLVRCEKLPSDVTTLVFKRPSSFCYMSGQWVRLACDTFGKHEFHPFTLTSAPHEDTLSVHIRAVGPWTRNIRETFDPEILVKAPKLYVDGPYGAGQQDWFQFEVAVLVGGGIGVTPYASILKDFVHLSSSKTFSKNKMKTQKLYFLWVNGSHRHYEWFIDILRQVEDVDTENVVVNHIFITQLFQKFDLRTTMLYICEEHFQKISGRSLFTGLRATTHFGRPQFERIFHTITRSHPGVSTIGVFSCGPQGLTRGVEKAAVEVTRASSTCFRHFFENF